MNVKLRILSTALLMTAATTPAIADTTLSVNGNKVETAVARMTFQGDNVNICFIDDSAASYDMGNVTLSFDAAGVGSITSFNVLTVSVGDKIEISGVTEGCMLQVFDLRGVVTTQATASGNKCEINISHLEGGPYILKAGNAFVKFIKH